MKVRALESKLSNVFEDHVEVVAVEETKDGTYLAHIEYDGVGDKGYKGTAEFKARVVDDEPFEIELVNYTGRGYKCKNVFLG